MYIFKGILTTMCVLICMAMALLSPAAAERFDGPGPYTFDYLLGEETNFNSDRKVLFIDYLISESVIRGLKARGKIVICYVNVGAWENWRPDAGSFPSSVLGNNMDGWPGERWLDIRQTGILIPLMRARFNIAAAKGCDGVEGDNIDGYTHNTGFSLTRAHQLTYNRAFLQAIRDLGMMAAQKNAVELTSDILASADFAIVEECHIWTECDELSPYVNSRRPVFAVEYREYISEDRFLRYACAEGEQLRMSFILKKLDLHADYLLSCISDPCAARLAGGRVKQGGLGERRFGRVRKGWTL